MSSVRARISGGFVVLDADDVHILRSKKWRVAKDGNRQYAVAGGGVRGSKVYLHRVIAASLPGLIVDHVNGDGLDNRRKNLRICSTAQNSRNSANYRGRALKGITARNGGYRAQIMVDRKRHVLGKFSTAEEAARAYDAAAALHFGEFARLNFPAGGVE